MLCYHLCLRQKRERKKERGVLKEGERKKEGKGRRKGKEGGREEERWSAACPWKYTQVVAMAASSVELGDWRHGGNRLTLGSCTI